MRAEDVLESYIHHGARFFPFVENVGRADSVQQVRRLAKLLERVPDVPWPGSSRPWPFDDLEDLAPTLEEAKRAAVAAFWMLFFYRATVRGESHPRHDHETPLYWLQELTRIEDQYNRRVADDARNLARRGKPFAERRGRCGDALAAAIVSELEGNPTLTAGGIFKKWKSLFESRKQPKCIEDIDGDGGMWIVGTDRPVSLNAFQRRVTRARQQLKMPKAAGGESKRDRTP